MPTNFPRQGDDKKISLRNSNYPQFDYDYALDLRERWPEIWRAGGNVRGNEAFTLWGRARDGSETDGVLDWIREREAWAARHFENSRLAGVVAQVKWGVIGSRGESYMKGLINEQKKDRGGLRGMERRYFEMQESRAEESDGLRRITGIIPYESKSMDLGGFVEEIKQGAFARSLREHDQLALWAHDPSRPLGRKSRGTLTLEDTPKGLRVSIIPPDTTWGRDAYESVRRGDVANMSFGFNVPQGGDSWREWGGKVIRALLDVDLREVSPVAEGAYPRSESATRDIYGAIPEIPAEFRGATDSADSEDDGAGALAIEKRKLDLLSLGGD